MTDDQVPAFVALSKEIGALKEELKQLMLLDNDL